MENGCTVVSFLGNGRRNLQRTEFSVKKLLLSQVRFNDRRNLTFVGLRRFLVPHGQGKLIKVASGGILYQGEWKSGNSQVTADVNISIGNRHGKGQGDYTHATSKLKGKYVGDWKDDVPSGTGLFQVGTP